MNSQSSLYGIQSTAGAVPVRNTKGEISMQKVKVHRYVSGKRPEYAQYASSDAESDEDDFMDNRRVAAEEHREAFHRRADSDEDDDRLPLDIDDPRIRRLQAIRAVEVEERRERHRVVHEPELVQSEEEKDVADEEEMPEEDSRQHLRHRERPEESDDEEDEEQNEDENNALTKRRISVGSESESDTELSDTEIERRRQMLKLKMVQQKKEEELLQKEDEGQSDSSESESSEYEETESEEENQPRLKPLFVRKKDRTTVIEKEREANKQKQLEYEAKKAAKERRRQTLKLVEDTIKKELEKAKVDNEPNLNDVNTDDENDEVEYEAWKLRELKRIKRDREEKDALDKEKTEIERLRNMSDEERRQEQRLNPKIVTNKTVKGKYKFLQKYYHRGAFYLDEEDQVYKQDFSSPTLEDHFDKTILPKVMQVKNFGRCGRTKYTHLVDQDTTKFDSPWFNDTANNVKFHNERAGGMKQVFDKPSLYKNKRDV
ncbi:microfibrillar-associated protein 1 [Toxorhynchites rutilus septentrionalis]|uniref:microfibrillar-associated protein 1 n=1 Tax=Toxorhynchites rutilus septentrionalis TaxID=329112 RepID=UPI00247A0C39|nr:microfibrillar-associated protein 1 [Toxorhynchites rutilus septentrionalis]